jgi:hypothetical protein
MALDEVTTHAGSGSERSLQVDGAANKQASECGSVERFLGEIHGERVAGELNNGEAGTVDCDGVTERNSSECAACTHDQSVIGYLRDAAHFFDDASEHSMTPRCGERMGSL